VARQQSTHNDTKNSNIRFGNRCSNNHHVAVTKAPSATVVRVQQSTNSNKGHNSNWWQTGGNQQQLPSCDNKGKSPVTGTIAAIVNQLMRKVAFVCPIFMKE